MQACLTPADFFSSKTVGFNDFEGLHQGLHAMAKTKTRQERMAEEAKVAATAAQALQVVEAAVAAEAAYSAQAVTAQPNTAEPEEAGPSTSAPLQNPQSSTIMINPPTAPPPPVLQVTDFRCSVAACMLCDHVQQAMHSELFCFNIKT